MKIYQYIYLFYVSCESNLFIKYLLQIIADPTFIATTTETSTTTKEPTTTDMDPTITTKKPVFTLLPCSTVSVVLKYDALTNILTGKYEGIYQESQPVNGKPSWKNEDNAIWYLKSENNWLIGPLKWIGHDAAYIHASNSFEGLTDYRNQWKYWDGSSWKVSSDSNDVTVTCKDSNLNGKNF